MRVTKIFSGYISEKEDIEKQIDNYLLYKELLEISSSTTMYEGNLYLTIVVIAEW